MRSLRDLSLHHNAACCRCCNQLCVAIWILKTNTKLYSCFLCFISRKLRMNYLLIVASLLVTLVTTHTHASPVNATSQGEPVACSGNKANTNGTCKLLSECKDVPYIDSLCHFGPESWVCCGGPPLAEKKPERPIECKGTYGNATGVCGYYQDCQGVPMFDSSCHFGSGPWICCTEK